MNWFTFSKTLLVLLVETSVQKSTAVLENFWFLDKKSKRYKPVDITTQGENSTTTPKMHFSKIRPITELKI